MSEAFSLVIAAYQAEDFLGKTLASVYSSTVMPDAVVVVDDASRDTTVDVALAWSDRLPMHVVRLDTNVGLGGARQAGVEAVGTPLIAFLDADDIVLPNHFQVLLEVFSRNGGIVTPRTLLWLPDGRLKPLQKPGGRNNLPRHDQLKHLLRRNYLVAAALMRTDDVRAAGGFRAMRRIEDWDLWLRMVTRGSSVSMPDTPTFLYRLRDGSLASSDIVQLEACIEVLERWRVEHRGHDLMDEAVASDLAMKKRLGLIRAEQTAQQVGARVSLRDGLRAVSPDLRTSARAAARVVLPATMSDRLFGWRPTPPQQD